MTEVPSQRLKELLPMPNNMWKASQPDNACKAIKDGTTVKFEATDLLILIVLFGSM